MTKETEIQEIESIKERLDMMNVKYPASAKVEVLRELLKKNLGTPETAEVQFANDLREKCTEMVRVSIHNQNPNKQGFKGEIITAGNSIVGDIRVFVPYNCPEAEDYELPRITIDALKTRKFLRVSEVGKGEQTRYLQEWSPEFLVTPL